MNTLFALSAFLYFLGTVKYLLHLALKNKTLFILATVMIALGFVMETAAFYQRALITHHGPYTNSFEYCAFGAWVVFFVFLVAELYFKIKPLGAFMAPLGFLLILLAFAFSSEVDPNLPVQAYWLTMHRTLSFLAFGAFALIFASGLMYLIQERQLKSKHFGAWYHRLPPLEALDAANRMGLIFGFPIITIGLIAAIAWSSQKYDIAMQFDTSTVALTIGWALYALLFFGRLVFGWRGRRAAILGVVGFGIVVFSLFIHIR